MHGHGHFTNHVHIELSLFNQLILSLCLSCNEMVHQVSEAFNNAFETIFKSDNGSGKSDEKTKDTIADRNGDKLILDQRISDWFRCNSCDYESEEKNKLYLYIANLHKPSDNLECKICNSEFTNDQLLENHTNDIHLKTKHFSCGICSYKSFYNQNLRRHISAQHKDKKRYPGHRKV